MHLSPEPQLPLSETTKRPPECRGQHRNTHLMLWFSCLFFSFLCAARCEDALEDEIASLDELIRLQVGQLRLPYSELIVTDRSLPGSQQMKLNLLKSKRGTDLKPQTPLSPSEPRYETPHRVIIPQVSTGAPGTLPLLVCPSNHLLQRKHWRALLTENLRII
jgi:hypothetical protein